ncbi:two-component system chemotaxis sensor kinase CheA [Lachnotalea glycerini]|uniref:Chemotaxis protein CheA n=1 Tax=Lachnotalea glycerini TaxID=1763509 RepID=A0A318ES10_9FIRM|nr:chemotaxis protein CheA [Lachnotalea glycerini]PXV93528.1 two-component system chemotaxis sensor kinase CheA [Lachnotalea glycerini]
MDVSQYLEIFIDETKEHLQSLNEQLLILEKEPENDDTINEIFRAAHSLKGMAGTMGYKRMQRLTHDMENVFSEIRNGKMKVSAGLVDVLFQCLDALEGYLQIIQETAGEGTNDNEPIITQLNAILNAETGVKVDKETNKTQEVRSVVYEESKYAPLYKDIELEPQEKHAISEAMERGLHVYGFTIYVQETCILKAARAFLVFKGIEDVGETIKSIPSVQDIEDERFDLHFSMYIISKETYQTVEAVIKNVSEIDTVIGEEFTYESISSLNKRQEKTEESVKESQPVTSQESKPSVQVVQKPQANNFKAAPQKPVVNRTVRVDIEKLDVLMNLVSELIIAKNGLVSVSSSETGENSQGFHEQIEYLERVTTNLHESVMKTRMVPIESVVNRFPRMIRDLNKKLNKKMELYMTGEDTELDRTVIDEIGDPLMHLLRNSADHGLESGEVRIARGKPEVGSIFLDAYQEGNNVIIEVRDDGNGIDVNAVRTKALERGTITPEQAESMSDKDIIDLLFLPSFSTAKTVSDVSGRGVGLDVVKSKIEALGGDVEVKSKLGEGSTWTIRLPLTLAIIQALMVELGNEKYAIALGSIQTIEDISVRDIKYVEAKEVIHIRETVIPLIRLDKVLGIVKDEEQPENLTVVIVKKGDKLAGLVVDNLMGQQEIVIKSLGKYINIDKVISGATILGDGEIALILDVNTLV